MFVDSCTYTVRGKQYTRHLLRESFRENGKVAHRTLANLSHCSDVEIQANEILRTREVLNLILSQHTGQPIERIAKDTDRDFYMTAEQAKEYGIVDDILIKQKVEIDEDEK